MAFLKLISLYCEKTEDRTGADEAYLLVNNQQVGGVNSINDKQSLNLEYIPPIYFESTAEIRLFDADSGGLDKDDDLGAVTATIDQISQGEIRGKFARYKAKYELTWRVSP